TACLSNAAIFERLERISGEDRLQLNELMDICTKLSDMVFSLEQTKTNQVAKIEKLKKRVKKLKGKKKKKKKKRTHGLKRLYKVGLSARVESYEDEEVAKIEKLKKRVKKLKEKKKKKRTHGLKRLYKRIEDQDLFRVHDLDGDEVFVDVTTGENVKQDATVAESVEGIAATTTLQISIDEFTLAQTLMEIKAAKPKAKGAKDKGKGVMVEPEKPFKKKDQIALDEEVARKLKAEMKAEMDEEERIARKKNEANKAKIEEWDDVQAIIDADRQLAKQIQAQEREQLSIKERSKLLAELIESRRQYFATKRAKDIRNKPPTKAQQKSLQCTYMKNMEGFKQKDFKGKSFDDINKMFDKVYKRVNTFMDMNTENVEESLKKTQAEIVPEEDDDVAIEATPLSSKSPTIVDYKIYREGKKSYFQIIRSCLETVKLLKSQNGQLLKDLKKSKLMVLGYKIGEIAIRELRKKLEIAQKEKDGFQLNVDKFEHASKSLNKLIECQIVDNCKKGLGYENYNAVPPPYTGKFMPPTPDLSFTGLDEFVNNLVAKNYKAKSSKKEPKVVRKNDDALIIKEWVSDNEENDVSQPKIEKKIVRPSIVKMEFVKSKQQEKTTMKAEVVNTACYVQNRVLVVKPHNKTPYELFHGRTPTLSLMRPFGCLVTILNIIDHLGKFDGKADEGFFVGYSLNSKAFRVFNSRTRIVDENMHIRFSESTPNVVGSRPDWLFDINALTRIMNYEPIIAGTQSNGFACTKASDNAGQARKETEHVKDCILLPLWTADPPFLKIQRVQIMMDPNL
nr:ribonuclease H-like domain-containing protein [Tanacetum cinerariifolium]